MVAFVLAWAASPTSAGAAGPTGQTRSFDFQPCTLTGSSGNGSLHAECSSWTRPLNPAAPDGEHIELFVARLPSTAIDPAADAFTIINGGPGASSIDLLVDMAQAVRSITRERDIVVLDQRGTGRSAPMSCEALTDTVDSPSAELTKELTQACLAALPHDPRFFTTSVAVQDLEALRAEMGYAQLSIYGVSYGTRVAMHYMRRFPTSARAAIVDGVVPPQVALGPDIAPNSQATLDDLFERCANSASCRTKFPQLRANFDTLRAHLASQSLPMTIRHPVTGRSTELDLTYAHLAMWIRLALYAPESSALLPLTLAQAAIDGDYLPIAANAQRLLHQLNTSMQYGMHNAVVCTEDTPYIDSDTIDLEALQATYLGSDIYQQLMSMCDLWPAGVIDDDLKRPLQSSIPTLVLSGQYDPITPPAYAEMILPGLSRARHIVAPGQGHGVLPRGCLPKLALDFIESADPDKVNDSCVAYLTPFPFFLDVMGPAP